MQPLRFIQKLRVLQRRFFKKMKRLQQVLCNMLYQSALLQRVLLAIMPNKERCNRPVPREPGRFYKNAFLRQLRQRSNTFSCIPKIRSLNRSRRRLADRETRKTNNTIDISTLINSQNDYFRTTRAEGTRANISQNRNNFKHFFLNHKKHTFSIIY